MAETTELLYFDDTFRFECAAAVRSVLPPAQRRVGDADETPGLHVADAGAGMGGLQQAPEHFGLNRIGGEMPHVAARADDAVDRRNRGRIEVAHGRKSPAAASGFDGK